MKPLIINYAPMNFPNGGALWSCHLSKWYKTDVYCPDTDLSKIHNLYYGYNITDNIKGYEDFTIVTSSAENYNDDIEQLLKDCKHPILIMIHDLLDVSHSYKEFWEKTGSHFDGYLFNTDETYNELPEWFIKKPWLRVRIPYASKEYHINFDEKEFNSICFVGRLVPDKGARQVALLAREGFNVYIAGQRVESSEYLLYYDKLIRTGSVVIPNPTDEKKIDIMKKSMFFASFTYHLEESVGVEFSALEAMNLGCFPIVFDCMEKYYNLGGLYFESVENHVDACKKIKKIIDNSMKDELSKEIFEASIISNQNNVMHWFDRDFVKLNNFVRKLKQNG